MTLFLLTPLAQALVLAFAASVVITAAGTAIDLVLMGYRALRDRQRYEWP